MRLRMLGNTFTDIQKYLKKPVPKSTLSYWFQNLSMDNKARYKLGKRIKNKLEIARQNSIISIKKKRELKNKEFLKRNKNLYSVINNPDTSRIALAILYLGEGFKNPKRSIVTFGNSDPKTIRLFLYLIKKCFAINETKFRCTVQCRADQDIKYLENFWQKITKISKNQFYKARIDPRTIGKPSKKLDYKGVCRIDYFSADVLNEILSIIEIITKGR